MRKLIGHIYWWAREVMEQFEAHWFEARIGLKWCLDFVRLPLTRAHWPLYQIIHRHYFKVLGHFPDLVKCPDFNDKVQWLELFDQGEQIIQCSDKIKVRDYISSRVGAQYLTKLYQTAHRYDDIQFDLLPNSFVIKTNHDAGTVFLIRDKTEVNHELIRARISASLSRAYGVEKGEWGYHLIEPMVMVEQFIDPQNAKPPPDYKFHCVNGKVKYLHYIYDRGGDTRELFFTPSGEVCDFNVYFPKGDLCRYEHPTVWRELIDIAEKVSAEFKYVRVDFFISQKKHIYIGEMTFWPMAGCYKAFGQRELGKALDFKRSSVKALVD